MTRESQKTVIMYRLLLTGVLLAVSPVLSASTPSLNIDTDRITVSGISAGAQMAHQLHIAYPDIFSGAGLIAGGPFGCAEGSLTTAISRCMGSVNGELPLAEFAKQIRSAVEQGWIGDTAALSDDRVWVFHGTDCSATESPFIGSCDYDAAGILLQQLYGKLEAPATELKTELIKTTLPGALAAGMDEVAYLFIPGTCTQTAQPCKTHLVLLQCDNHGFSEL